MASYVKFNDFVEQLEKGVHVFGTHTFKLALTNTLPVATQTDFDPVTNHAAPAAANGYTTGGHTVTVAISETPAGTSTVTGVAVTYTATPGGIGPVSYAVLYNDTSTNDKLVAYWAIPSAPVNLADTETLTVTFGGASPGTIHTLS